jgi:hypothetical protein
MKLSCEKSFRQCDCVPRKTTKDNNKMLHDAPHKIYCIVDKNTY